MLPNRRKKGLQWRCHGCSASAPPRSRDAQARTGQTQAASMLSSQRQVRGGQGSCPLQAAAVLGRAPCQAPLGAWCGRAPRTWPGHNSQTDAAAHCDVGPRLLHLSEMTQSQTDDACLRQRGHHGCCYYFRCWSHDLPRHCRFVRWRSHARWQCHRYHSPPAPRHPRGGALQGTTARACRTGLNHGA